MLQFYLENYYEMIGPFFRSKKICHNNLSTAFPKLETMKRKYS